MALAACRKCQAMFGPLTVLLGVPNQPLKREAPGHEGALYAEMYSMCYHMFPGLGVFMSGIGPQAHIQEVISVSSVEAIQSAIASLTPEEYTRLREWFIERDCEQWDKQIEEDAQSGKLDFLIAEAMAEKAQGHLRDL